METKVQIGAEPTPEERKHLEECRRDEMKLLENKGDAPDPATVKPRVMSRAEAAFTCMEMARGGVLRNQCEALQLAVRSLVKRHFDCMKNRINRKARQ